MIDEKVIDKIIALKRPELIDTINGQHIYNDNNKSYSKITRPFLDSEVSNIESFAAYLLKINERFSLTEGKFTTVTFSQNSALCRLEDSPTEESRIKYKRALSPQFSFLLEKLGRRLSHAELLRVFQGLRPSFPSQEAYNEFMRQYRKVSFDEKVTVNSQPQVEQGKGGSSIIVEFGRNGGMGETALPSSLTVKLQYARDSKRFYECELEIDSTLNTDPKDKPKLEFSLLWPEKDNVVAQAVADEIADFKSLAAEKLPELLVVVNY